MKDKFEIGIVGAGTIVSKTHLPLLSCLNSVSVKYIADIQDPQQLADCYNTDAIKIVDDLSVLPDCDVVLLAIPVGVRANYIREYSKRNIPIFSEKPYSGKILLPPVSGIFPAISLVRTR